MDRVTEIDGVEGTPGIIVIAATQRADVLDSALTRGGYLLKFTSGLVCAEAREESFHTHYQVPSSLAPSLVRRHRKFKTSRFFKKSIF